MVTLLWSASYWSIHVILPYGTVEKKQPSTLLLSMAGEWITTVILHYIL
jgi:hypothetical protein